MTEKRKNNHMPEKSSAGVFILIFAVLLLTGTLGAFIELIVGLTVGAFGLVIGLIGGAIGLFFGLFGAAIGLFFGLMPIWLPVLVVYYIVKAINGGETRFSKRKNDY